MQFQYGFFVYSFVCLTFFTYLVWLFHWSIEKKVDSKTRTGGWKQEGVSEIRRIHPYKSVKTHFFSHFLKNIFTRRFFTEGIKNVTWTPLAQLYASLHTRARQILVWAEKLHRCRTPTYTRVLAGGMMLQYCGPSPGGASVHFLNITPLLKHRPWWPKTRK